MGIREIIFRGKEIDTGKWVYGFYHKETSIESPASDRKITHHHIYTQDFDLFVDPETVGQYTGLCDKNGKKIFEGDIIQLITADTHEKRFAVVKFGKYRDANFEDSAMGFYLEVKGCQFSMFSGEAQGYDLLSLIEVVGNIYDNPELEYEVQS